MRGGTDVGINSALSPTRAQNGTSTSPTFKGAVLNGATNGTVARNGEASPHTNGAAAPNALSLQPTFYGHDREEVTRILIQGLQDMGYEHAASSLSRESGYDLETPYASAFRMAILQGDWAEAEALLSDTDAPDEGGGVMIEQQQQSNGSVRHSQPTSRGGPGRRNSQNGLALSEEADKREMLFLIRQQKYLEFLEMRDLGAALMVLRTELQPLHQDERQLHALSSLIMCQSTEDLKFQAHWDGALGDSRKQLLSELSRSISPSVMIPEHRLAELLTQVKESQILNCPYHNTLEWPSLYVDHNCERDDFPLENVYNIEKHRDEVWFLQFSNDGTRLATASRDTVVAIFDTTSFQMIHELSSGQSPVAYVAWNPDDTRLLSCAQNGEVRLWDTSTGVCLHTIKHNNNDPATTAAWAPDGLTYVTGSFDIKRPLAIWSHDSRSDVPLHNFENNCPRVQDCAISTVSPPSSSIFAADESLHNSSSSRPIRLVAICINKSIHVFDYLRREKLSHIQLDHDLTCLNISSDGQEMLVNLSCDEIWAIGIEDGQTRQKFRGQKQGNFVIRSCLGGASEGFVVSGAEDSKISLWHRHSGRLLEQLSGHRSGCVNAVAWNKPFPSMFASAGDDFVVRIWSKPHKQHQIRQLQSRVEAEGQGSNDSSHPGEGNAQGEGSNPGPPRWGSGEGGAGDASGPSGNGEASNAGGGSADGRIGGASASQLAAIMRG